MRQRSCWVCLAFAAGLLLGPGAVADEKKAVVDAALADPSLTALAQSNVEQVVLEAAEEGTNLAAKIGWTFGDPFGGDSRVAGLTVALKLKAPLDKTTGGAELLNLDGLTGKAVGSLSATFEIESYRRSKAGGTTALCKEFNRSVQEQMIADRPQWKPISEGECSVEAFITYDAAGNEVAVRGGWWRDKALPIVAEVFAQACTEVRLKEPSPPVWIERFEGVHPSCHAPGYDARACEALTANDPRVPAWLVGSTAPACEQKRNDGSYPTLAECCPECCVDCCSDDLLTRRWQAGGSVGSPQTPATSVFCWVCPAAQSTASAWPAERKKRLAKALKPLCDLYNKPPIGTMLPVTGGSGKDQCTTEALEAQGGDWLLRALRTSTYEPWFVTLDLGAANNSFGFTDPATLESQKVSKENTSLGLAVGKVLSGVYYSLAYLDQRVFSGASAIELCTPLPEVEAEQCVQTALAPPKQTDLEIARLDVKSVLSRRLAVNLRLNYDLDKDESEPHLFFYFLRQKKKGLTGGIDLFHKPSTSEDGGGFGTRVFIGTAFQLTPG